MAAPRAGGQLRPGQQPSIDTSVPGCGILRIVAVRGVWESSAEILPDSYNMLYRALATTVI